MVRTTRFDCSVRNLEYDRGGEAGGAGVEVSAERRVVMRLLVVEGLVDEGGTFREGGGLCFNVVTWLRRNASQEVSISSAKIESRAIVFALRLWKRG